MNKELFIKELQKLNINLTNDQLEKLETYTKLLIIENKKYNLTSIVEEENIYLKHFYDSLTITKIIKLDNQSLCDMGTGAGFPGLVLKIAFPNLKLTLMDATAKKCEFLKLVADTLDLKDVSIINTRIEEYAKENREMFDIVTARAVAPIKHLLEYGIPLVKVNGCFIPLKGQLEEENLTNYYNKLDIKLEDIIEFNLPIENSKRTLLKFSKLKKTNKLYPRKYNEIKKKSL